MKAIVLSEYGGPEKLELQDWPEPEPGAGQLKVRVASASLNPVDWKQRSGALKAAMPLELPAVLGRDAAGEVVKVGAGVTAFEVGDRVLGVVNGGYAEFVVAPVAAWAAIPEDLAPVDAGALPLVILTGDQLADATLSGKSGTGSTVLVTGAVGAVGRVAAFVLKQRGAKVLVGVRGKQLDEAKKLNADGVIALDDDAAVAELPTLDAVADTVGGDTIAKLLPKIKKGGTIGSVLGETQGAKERGLTVNAFHAQPNSERLATLAASVASGELYIPISNRFPLADASEAHALAEKGGVGKVLLIP